MVDHDSFTGILFPFVNPWWILWLNFLLKVASTFIFVPWRGASKRDSYNRLLVHVFYYLLLLILLFMFVTWKVFFLTYSLFSHVGMNGNIRDPHTFMVSIGWHMHQIWTVGLGRCLIVLDKISQSKFLVVNFQ